MCGIVGYVGPKDCSEVLVNALTKLEYRGYDSAGIAVFDNGEIKTVKTKGKLQDLKDKLAEVGTPKGHVGIGHTRWATHGEPSDVNSHPHSGTRVTIVHNGIIENYMELKDFLISKGRTFLSDTDTEVVAQLLDYKYNGNPLETIDSVMAELKGSFALGIMFKDFPDRVFAVRRESPLIVGVAEGECFIASDVPAILQYTRDYYLLDHDEIVTLSPDGVSFVDEHLDPIEKELQTADWDMEAAEKGGYPHFMIKEINEQPEAIRTTIMPRIKEGLPFLEECGITTETIKNFKNITIVACGTAMHAGMVGKYVIEDIARVPVNVDIASEFRYRNPIVGEGDLVIIISQSGETADSLAAMRLAKQKGAKTLAIVNAKGSSIAREADMLIYTLAGPEISVPSTKAYITQLSVMYLFAFELALAKETISTAECKRLVSALTKMPEAVQYVIDNCEDICKFVATKLVATDVSCADRVLAAIYRHGRVTVADLAVELELSEEDVLEACALLLGWGSIAPWYEEGEKPSPSYYPTKYQTLPRDAAGYTTFDGRRFDREHSTAEGDVWSCRAARPSSLHKSVRTPILAKAFSSAPLCCSRGLSSIS